MQELVIEACWGWYGHDLGLIASRGRSLLNVGMLCTLNRAAESAAMYVVGSTMG